ncbi:MAG: carbohydrate ABC transporter permease [Terriglobia bacterium]
MKKPFWIYLALALALGVTLVPIYWLVTISLKTVVEQFVVPPLWFHFQVTLEHYYDTFFLRPFGTYFWNSVLVAAVATALALTLGVPAAYALARLPMNRNWSRHLSFWILSTRMVPPIVTILPLFLLLRNLGLLNTRLSLILVYTGFNLPFVIWMMRGFFVEFPSEVEEAAWVDGSSRLRALVDVVLPLVTPGLAATAIFCLIIAWNEFLFALILTQTDAAMTLPVGIAGRVTQYEIKWGAMSAAGVVAMLPIFLFALAVQRYLVRGMSLGAVKG